LARWGEIQSSGEVFAAILHARGMDAAAALSNEQKLAIYRDYKRLSAIALQPDGETYKYAIRVASEGSRQGAAVTGTISRNGVVAETSRQPTVATCPICLPEGVLIDTPQGNIAVERVTSRTYIWTRNLDGTRIAARVSAVARTPVPGDHQVVRVTLADGRAVTASPGHPTADGVPFADLRRGDALDGSLVVAAERIPYSGRFTYDLLPESETGIYWADGVPVRSTLK
jgi:hypothetical protein